MNDRIDNNEKIDSIEKVDSSVKVGSSEGEKRVPRLRRVIVIVVCVAILAFLVYCNLTA